MSDFLDKDQNLGYSTNTDIHYSSILREYYINDRQSVFFCPWCGTKLPVSLRQEYCEELLKNHNIKINLYLPSTGKFDRIKSDLELCNDPKIPAEFKTDRWWKKLGL